MVPNACVLADGHADGTNAPPCADGLETQQSTQLFLTLVMTIEYNGFQYAGFQRQAATHQRPTVPRGAAAFDRGTNNVANGRGNTIGGNSVNNDIDAIDASARSSPTTIANESSSASTKGAVVEGKRDLSQRSQSASMQQQQPQPRPSKKSKKNKGASTTPITVQHQLETALQKWTNL